MGTATGQGNPVATVIDALSTLANNCRRANYPRCFITVNSLDALVRQLNAVTVCPEGTFSWALEMMRQGKRVRRTGEGWEWPDKCMQIANGALLIGIDAGWATCQWVPSGDILATNWELAPGVQGEG